MTHKTEDVREAFEREYSCGEPLIDGESLARSSDGEYEQSLARLCFKWFCKGRAATRPKDDIADKLAGDLAIKIQAANMVREYAIGQKRSDKYMKGKITAYHDVLEWLEGVKLHEAQKSSGKGGEK